MPAALIGLNVSDILKRARHMAKRAPAACRAGESRLVLGAALAELTLAKRDKITFLCSPSLTAFPAWIEQLIAESTGKDRKGIVPVAGKKLGAPEKYGSDRAFVYLRYESDENHELDRQVAGLEANGHPVLRIEIIEKTDLGQEFFRWELAIAAAGSALGIHPFNQPDVQLAKDLATKAMTEARGGSRRGGRLKEETSASDDAAMQQAVSSWTSKAKARDYVSVQAYISPTPEHDVCCRASVNRCAIAWARRLRSAMVRVSFTRQDSSTKAARTLCWFCKLSISLPMMCLCLKPTIHSAR